MSRIRFAAGAFVAAVLVACSSASTSADAGAPVAGSCDAISSACHAYDKISSTGHDCHELGHAGDDAKCAPEREKCLTACPPRDASAAQDQDASVDAQTDAPAPSQLCVDLCGCLDQVCKAKAGYPFSAASSCLDTCAGWSAAQHECYPKWCKLARTNSTGHVCEHAWGAHALDECDTL